MVERPTQLVVNMLVLQFLVGFALLGKFIWIILSRVVLALVLKPLSSYFNKTGCAWSAVKFTTRPKDREVFVGKDVQLDWGYESDDGNNKVETVQFGVKIGSNEIAFVNKDVQSGMLTWGPESKFPKVESFKKKTKVVLNSADKEWKASIVISQLAMNDTGFIFCKLKGQDPSQRQPSESVFLKVVGK